MGVAVVLIILGSAVVLVLITGGFTVPVEVRVGSFNPLGAEISSFRINVCLSSFLLNNTGELPVDASLILVGTDVDVILMTSTSGKSIPSSSVRICAGRASTKLVMLSRSSMELAENSYLK